MAMKRQTGKHTEQQIFAAIRMFSGMTLLLPCRKAIFPNLHTAVQQYHSISILKYFGKSVKKQRHKASLINN
jgi:hypothetical protein